MEDNSPSLTCGGEGVWGVGILRPLPLLFWFCRFAVTNLVHSDPAKDARIAIAF